MKILVTGATGYLAAQITRSLIKQGHQVTCCVRNIALSQRMFPQAQHISCDFEKDVNSEIWLPRLNGIDVVINAVGIFYHPNEKIFWRIHYETPKALFNAAQTTQVKKIIHISALGIQNANVTYARSKKAIDDYLTQLEIPSIILRPSLIYGRGSYGGSSLFRGLAGLPGILPVPGKGDQLLQPIHIDDLANAVTHLVNQEQATNKLLLAAVGPEQVTLTNILLLLRLWLCFSKPLVIPIPLWMIYLASLVGNLIPHSVTNSTAYYMLMQHNVASHEQTDLFAKTVGFQPANFSTGLFSESSSVQDRWHAKLYFLSPLLRFSLALMWLMSVVTTLFLYPKADSYLLLEKVGVSTSLQPFFLYGACFINVMIAIGLLMNVAIKKLCLLQIAIILLYTLIITIKLPYLWLDPFGPLVKNIPILVSILILLALENER